MALKLSMSTPFANRKAILKGLLAGSLMVGALLSSFWFPWRILLFVGGLLIFLDGMLPYGRELHTGSVLAMTIVGGAISLVLTFLGGSTAYLVLVVIVGVALYATSYMMNRTKTWI